MTDNYLSIKAAAEHLGLHWQTIRNYLKSGKLSYFKAGRAYRIPKGDIERLAVRGKTPLQRKSKVEIERRFLLTDRTKIEDKVRKLGAKLVSNTHVIDHWYVPENVTSMQANLKFYENLHGFSLRIRETQDLYANRTSTCIEVKKLIDGKNHGNCLEHDIVVDSFAEAGKLLELMNFKRIISLDKQRVIYTVGNLKLAFDSIKGLGDGLEIEINQADKFADAEKEIFRFAAKLGLKQTDVLNKSLTYLALQKMADFS